jgi:16S rRNA processing protein RimM
VSRAHGLKGAVMIKTFDPSSSALGTVDRLRLVPKTGTPREFELLTVRDAGGDLLVELKGLSRREEADLLVGSTVFVHRDEVDQPEDGEFFQGDLVGLTAVAEDGRSLGIVAEVWSSGPVPNLVLRNGDHEEMVPFADDFVVKIDLDERTIVLKPLVFDTDET